MPVDTPRGPAPVKTEPPALGARLRLLLPACLLLALSIPPAAAQTESSLAATITATSPATLAERDLDGAKVTVALVGVIFVAGPPDSGDFELVTEIPGLSIDVVDRVEDLETGRPLRDRVELRLQYDGTDFDEDGKLAVKVKAAAHGGSADVATNAVPVEAAQEGSNANLVLETSPPVGLGGGGATFTTTVAASVAVLTVTARAEDPNASVTVDVSGRAVDGSGASRVSAVVALAAPGTSTTVTIVVTPEDGTTSRTYTLHVVRMAGAAPSARIASTDPSPLAEKELDEARVVVALSGVAFVAGLPDPAHFEPVAANVPGLSVDGVERIRDGTTGRYRRDRVEVRLGHDATDFDADGTLAVRVKAAAHGGGADLTTATVPVTAVQEASDATLSSLTISPGQLVETFVSGTQAYTANVSATSTALVVTATASDADASITVDGRAVASGRASHPVALSAPGGSTTVTIVVTAEDGTTTITYTITASRAAGTGPSPSAAIASTTPSPLAERELDGARVVVALSGVIFVAGPPDPAHFEPVAADVPGLSVDGVERITDEATGGDRPDRVVVRLQHDATDFDADGTLAVRVKAAAHGGGADLTTATVPVVARQEASDADLAGLALSPGTLAPEFAAGTTVYAAAVEAPVASLTVTATAADAGASITVNDRPAASGRASHAVALSAPGGSATVTVVVTAEDGATTRTYRVAVERKEPPITADLNGSGGIDANDGLLMYYVYTFPVLGSNSELGRRVRRFLTTLRGRTSTYGNDDEGYRAMVQAASDWKDANLAQGDLNGSGAVDRNDGLLMYYVYTFPVLGSDSALGARVRQFLATLRGRTSTYRNDDTGYRAMVRATNQLRSAFKPQTPDTGAAPSVSETRVLTSGGSRQ